MYKIILWKGRWSQDWEEWLQKTHPFRPRSENCSLSDEILVLSKIVFAFCLMDVKDDQQRYLGCERETRDLLTSPPSLQQMATGQKYEQLEQHPLFKSYFQDDASSPCAGLAVFGCLDLPAWPFHTLSSSVRPGAFHSTLHWESPSSHMITYFCSGLHIFGKSREHNQESCSCLYRPSWGDQVGSSWSGKDFHLLDQIILSRFHPAHMLKDPAMERKGRLWNLDQIFRNVWQYPYKFTASFASPC